jgi:hypothetical protein
MNRRPGLSLGGDFCLFRQPNSAHAHQASMKVALDAMGGDYAPAVNIGGAIEALRYYPKIQHLYLVGDEAVLRPNVRGRVSIWAIRG